MLPRVERGLPAPARLWRACESSMPRMRPEAGSWRSEAKGKEKRLAKKIGHLLPSQVQDVGRILGRMFPDSLASFRWAEPTSGYHGPMHPTLYYVAHDGAPFYCRFKREKNRFKQDLGHVVEYSPGKENEEDSFGPIPWGAVRLHVTLWLEYLKRELGASGFWAAARAVAGGAPMRGEDAEDRQLTEDERGQVRGALDDLEERVTHLELEHGWEREFVRTELSVLREEVGKLKRYRWIKLALGTLASMAVKGILPESTLTEWWTIIRDAAGLGPARLPGGP